MKNALIVLGSNKDEALNLCNIITAFLLQEGITSSVFKYTGVSHSFESDEIYDFAVSLGGDGTVLFTARFCAPRSIPVFPINFGHFGFIASIEPKHWKRDITKFLNGKLGLYKRALLFASVKRAETLCTFEALNDVVISGSGIAKLINLEISFNGISFGIFRSDGIIVSTPTGSTAYSAAAGGPILYPDVAAIVLTPIVPFSLSNRPLVLPASGELKIKLAPMRTKNIILSIDGQELFPLEENDEILVTESKYCVEMAGCSPENFYKALRSKLGWSGGI